MSDLEQLVHDAYAGLGAQVSVETDADGRIITHLSGPSELIESILAADTPEFSRAVCAQVLINVPSTTDGVDSVTISHLLTTY